MKKNKIKKESVKTPKENPFKKLLTKIKAKKVTKQVAEEVKHEGKYAIEMKKVTKTFAGGKIVANSNVDLAVKWNEIHAICGENGAGKSTLMSILFGLYKQDAGEIWVRGKKVNFKNAMQANAAGLGMVHQHFKLVNAFSLLDNIILGAETTKNGFIYKKPSEKRIKEICERYGFNFDIHQKTAEATVGTQQKVEIVKLLFRGAEVLIFDEPTAVLSDDEIAGFLDMLRVLKKQGKTIILITHKLNEVLDVADRVTVLRKGMSIGTHNIKDVDTAKLVELIVGQKIVEKPNNLSYAIRTNPIIKIKNIKMHKQNDKRLTAINNLSLDVYPGEIVGIAGIEGNGQSELALALAGIQHPDKGTIEFRVSNLDIDITHEVPKVISNLGISHVPEDRHKYGCILDETVAFNLVSNQIDNKLFKTMGFLRLKEIDMNANNLCAKFNVLGANKGKAIFRSLSGGNQQKVVVARELSKKHEVIVLVQPTRGLDIGAINNIHEYILDEAKKGKTVILISYELDEILKIASRVIVMDHGDIVLDAPKVDIDRQTIGKYLMKTGKAAETAGEGGK